MGRPCDRCLRLDKDCNDMQRKHRKILVCKRCRRRGDGCDRQQPCGGCSKADVECVYYESDESASERYTTNHDKTTKKRPNKASNKRSKADSKKSQVPNKISKRSSKPVTKRKVDGSGQLDSEDNLNATPLTDKGANPRGPQSSAIITSAHAMRLRSARISPAHVDSSSGTSRPDVTSDIADPFVSERFSTSGPTPSPVDPGLVFQPPSSPSPTRTPAPDNPPTIAPIIPSYTESFKKFYSVPISPIISATPENEWTGDVFLDLLDEIDPIRRKAWSHLVRNPDRWTRAHVVDTIVAAKYAVPHPTWPVQLWPTVVRWDVWLRRFQDLGSANEAAPIAALGHTEWHNLVTFMLFVDEYDPNRFMVGVICGPAQFISWYDPSEEHKDGACDEFFEQFKAQLLFEAKTKHVLGNPNDWAFLRVDNFPRLANLVGSSNDVSSAPLVCAFTILLLQEITPTWSALGLPEGRLQRVDLQALGRSLISLVLAVTCLHESFVTEEHRHLAHTRLDWNRSRTRELASNKKQVSIFC